MSDFQAMTVRSRKSVSSRYNWKEHAVEREMSAPCTSKDFIELQFEMDERYYMIRVCRNTAYKLKESINKWLDEEWKE